MNGSSANIRAMIAIALGAGVWGLFWIPLRHLDQLGVTGFWAIAMITGCSFLAALPVALWRKEFKLEQLRDSLLIGIGIGLSMVLYFIGLLTSDVIRVIFLFYLLPVWTALVSKFLFGEVLGPVRLVCIFLALFGLWLLIGEGKLVPVPKHIGDWCGIAAGFLWGFSLAVIRDRNEVGPFASGTVTFAFAFCFSILLGMLFNESPDNLPSKTAGISLIAAALPLAIAFGALILLPSLIAQVWGARLTPAPTAALLTMTEILFATASAWFLIGTSLSTISIVGGLLIVTAVLIDLRYQFKTYSQVF